jgi:hypothetical protein
VTLSTGVLVKKACGESPVEEFKELAKEIGIIKKI